MIAKLDHLIFGNGYGLKAPFFDSVYYWLSGEMYTYSGGLGAQLQSIQWTHPRPGERRTLLGREFAPFHSKRVWLRVRVSWRMTYMPDDIDEANAALRLLKEHLRNPSLSYNV